MINSIFQKNWDALTKNHPGLKDLLQEEVTLFENNPSGNADERYEIVKTGNQNLNLLYSRREPALTTLIHGFEPIEEAKEILRSYNLENPSVLALFGFGLGYLLKEFLSQRPVSNFSILVIERDPQAFIRALACVDFSKEFNDDSIFWIVSRDVGIVTNKLIDFFVSNTTVDRHLKVVGSPQSLAIDNEYYTKVGRAMMEARDHCVLLVGNSVNDQMLGFDNVMDNMDLIFQNPGLQRLEKKFEGRVCLSIAAGPSVNEHWDTIKSLQGKIPIIACDTLLKPMSDRGIYPDFYTALERDDYVPKLFRNIYVNERSTLVAPMLLAKESFDCYKGEELIYTPSPLYTEGLNLQFLGRFHPGSSAGNLNCALAAYLGFKTIIMIGHNLAYGFDTHETHAAGTIDPDRERARSEEELKKESKGLRVGTQDEKDVVWTRVEWNYFRKQLEQLFVSREDCQWINTAPKGAFIKGAKLMSLAEALKEFHREEYDMNPDKRALLEKVAEQDIYTRKVEVLKGVYLTIKSLKSWLSRAEEIQEKLLKWEAKIKDKEVEGRRVSLEFLDSKIDEVLEIKVTAVNDDRLFYQTAITILMPFHATFERLLNQMMAEYKDEYLLKRDFLLRHKQYFEGWEKNIPRILKRLEPLEEVLRKDCGSQVLEGLEELIEVDQNQESRRVL